MSGQTVTCTVTPAGGLAAGASLPNIAVTVNPTPAAVPSVTNTATVANANDLDPDNNSSSSVTGIDLVADLAITKTDGTSAVSAGGSTTYTLVVTNNGPSTVSGAILADPAVAGLAKTGVACAGTPGQCVSPPSIVAAPGWHVRPARPGQRPDLPAQRDRRRDRRLGQRDQHGHGRRPDRGDRPGRHQQQRHRHRHGHPGPGLADLSITKTDGTTTVAAGGSTTYTLVVTNGGPSSVTGALLADPAATGLAKTAVACAPTPGQCVSPPSVAQLQAGTFALPALASGQTYRLSVSADVTAVSGSVTNTATVAAPAGTTDPDGTNNSATDTDTVNPAPAPGLTLAKSASPTTYTAAGDVIAYTYLLTNSGNVALDGPFTVADDKATVTCPVTATLAVGASITCTASYTITAADVTAGSVTNVATASSADATTSNEASITVRVRRSPPPTVPPTPPNTGALTAAGSSVPETGWLGLLVIGSILAAASLLTWGWVRRRR